MTKISDALTYGLTIRESATDGSDFTNPASDYRRLFLGEDGKIHVKDSAGAVTDPYTSGAGSDLVQTASGAGSIRLPGILVPDRVPGSPHGSDDEFDTTDTTDPITGWTTLGDPSILNTNSDAASHLRLGDSATGTFQVHGIYKASPATPFTVTTKITDAKFDATYQHQGIMLLETGPGKLMTAGPLYGAGGARNYGYGLWNSRTSRASFIDAARLWDAKYFRMIVTSDSSVATYASVNGLAWHTLNTAVNPGFTIAYVGLFVSGEDNSVAADAYFDWVRFQ